VAHANARDGGEAFHVWGRPIVSCGLPF
jgi:hypothetical protein